MKDKRNYLSSILISGLFFSISAISAVAQTLTGTITNLNGEYEITVSFGEDVLVFSSIGYETVRISVGDQNQIDVALLNKVLNSLRLRLNVE